MKRKTIIWFAGLLAIAAIIFVLDSENREMCSKASYYVEQLNGSYESYGLFGGYGTETKGGKYSVSPIGRLVNVKINRASSDFEYTLLKARLKVHFLFNSRVKNVYTCNGGTIMVDCRR